MNAPSLPDIEAAAARIAKSVRRTPLIAARPAREAIVPEAELWLKLESLQVTGSFKARGAMSKLTLLDSAAIARGLVTASGGNHGLGVAYAGWTAGAPTRIYLPRGTPPAKADRLKSWGAEVILHGEVWDEANDEAMRAAAAEGLTYMHPFADPAVIAGQGTIALEMLEVQPDLDLLLVAIGGGGLIAGIATAAKTLKPGIKVIGVEPTGAPTLHDSRRAGVLVTLPEIKTSAGTLAPRRSDELNFGIIERNVDDIVLVSDEAMEAAARWLWFECGVAAELSGAASVAALLAKAYQPPAGARVAALVCGAGTDGIA